jgi:pectate lyase
MIVQLHAQAMKLVFAISIFLLGLDGLMAQESASSIPAFPGAEGFGAKSVGGRGGRVLHVTTLADYNPKIKKDVPIEGSLRWAISQAGPRTIVFDVGGLIELKNGLVISEPHVTIAGQTAPGDGICLKNFPLLIQADEVIVRYLRIRTGDEVGKEMDAVSVIEAKNVIVDHCSTSWSVDEALSVTGEGCDRVSIQWCMITESLDQSAHSKGTHGYGSLIRADGGISFHHNFYAHHRTRCPRPGTYGKLPGLLLDFRNNLIYNWISPAGYTSSDPARINYVGNYLRPGPSTTERGYMFNIGGKDTQMFVEKNYLDHSPVVNKKDWDWVEHAKPEHQMRKAFDVQPVKTESANKAMQRILESVGASLPRRDAVDRRVIEEFQTNSGKVINSPAEVGGWPTYAGGQPVVDTDRDGLPDTWEKMHGLNSQLAGDGSLDGNRDGYTNLEDYLNQLGN